MWDPARLGAGRQLKPESVREVGCRSKLARGDRQAQAKLHGNCMGLSWRVLLYLLLYLETLVSARATKYLQQPLWILVGTNSLHLIFNPSLPFYYLCVCPITYVHYLFRSSGQVLFFKVVNG